MKVDIKLNKEEIFFYTKWQIVIAELYNYNINNCYNLSIISRKSKFITYQHLYKIRKELIKKKLLVEIKEGRNLSIKLTNKGNIFGKMFYELINYDKLNKDIK